MRVSGTAGIRTYILLGLMIASLLGLIASCGNDGAFYTSPPSPPEPPPEEVKKASSPTFLSPIRITTAGEGEYAITDAGRGAVVFVNSSLKETGALYVPGTPMGVAVYGNTVFVSNTKSGNVNAFSRATGRYLYTVGGGYGINSNPTDLAIDEEDGLLFVLASNNRVVRSYSLSNPTGAAVEDFPSWVMPVDDILKPTAMTLDTASNRVYVSDYGTDLGGAHGGGADAPRIQVYSYTGTRLNTIPSTIEGFQFSSPQGLTVDSSGNLYFADIIGGRVLIFDSTGAGITNIGTQGTGPGELFVPLDLVLDEDTGSAYVTSNRSSRVVIINGAVQ